MSSFETTISAYGPTTPYVLTVTNPHFATDPEDQYSPEVPRLRLEGLVDDPDWPDGFTPEFKVGKNWQVTDEGATVTHSAGRKQFDGRTAYGILIDSIVKGSKDSEHPNQGELQELLNDLASSGEAYEAAIWAGKKLVVDAKKETATIEGEVREFARLIIVGYEGSDDDAATNAATSREEASKENMERIKELANSSDSHATFVNSVMAEGLSKDPNLTQQLMDSSDEGLYTKLRNEG